MTWLYRILLRLYPTSFYDQFADEMTETFQLVRQDNPSPLAGQRELAMLLVSIIHEHSRLNTVWYMLVVMMPPALLGLTVLLFRPLHRFYLSTNIWLLFAGLSLFILLMGWLLERRLTVLALPILGFMLHITYRIFLLPGSHLSPQVHIATPFLLLIVVLIRHRLDWKSWLPHLIALPVTGIMMSLIVVGINGASGLPIGELWNGYILGALIPMFLSLLILAGMPFARLFGSAAVLFIVGYLFFDLLGLSATLPDLDWQQITAIGHVLLFLLVMPVLILRFPRYRILIVLIAITFAYGVIFFIKVGHSEMDATFFLYRLNELFQTLIALHFAMRLYDQLQRPADPEMIRGDAPLRQVG